MTDLHCHILPGVDDGAPDLTEALNMARLAAESGVDTVVATPHCNLPGSGRPNYLDTGLMERVETLRQAIGAEGIPLKLCAGAEVFCTPALGALLDQRRLMTLAGSRYLLMEFYFDESPEFITECLETVTARGMIPVVAHPERYEAVQRFPGHIPEWFSRGYVIQLNKGSILGRLGSRAQTAARWILRRGLAHTVASDAHSARFRTPYMDEIRRYLEEEYGTEYARILLSGNPRRIIRDTPVLKP